MKRSVVPHAGFSLIEVLVTIVLLTVGLLGLAALQARTSVAEAESYQRAQALVLAQDMADRIAANRTTAASYVANNIGTGTTTADCSTLTGAALDLCQWGNTIRGTTESSGGVNIGTLLGGRGCITNPATNRYLVIVVWQGMIPTAQPSVTCGSGSYGAEEMRRAVVVPVQIAKLT